MTASLEADRNAARAEDFFNQELAQFEPDPDGAGSNDEVAATGESGDDPQWIVWPDPIRESEWIEIELAWTIDPW
jgi:hypothetical protein